MSLIAELKRRNVFRVGVAYAIVAWLLIEITATTFPILKLPDWSVTLVTVLVLIGFPLALIVAWAFELTPEGIKRETDVDPAESVRPSKGRKLDFAIIGLLAVALIFVAVDNYVLEAEQEQAEGAAEQFPAAESVALGATPVGSEFQLNTYTTDAQQRPSVSVDADRSFVVVWNSYGGAGSETSNDSI